MNELKPFDVRHSVQNVQGRGLMTTPHTPDPTTHGYTAQRKRDSLSVDQLGAMVTSIAWIGRITDAEKIR